MNRLGWNERKSRDLKRLRGISFDEIIDQRLVDIIQHPIKHHQRLYIYVYENYCWVVPCVTDGDQIFLKTIYPSRKFTKKYLNRES